MIIRVRLINGRHRQRAPKPNTLRVISSTERCKLIKVIQKRAGGTSPRSQPLPMTELRPISTKFFADQVHRQSNCVCVLNGAGCPTNNLNGNPSATTPIEPVAQGRVNNRRELRSGGNGADNCLMLIIAGDKLNHPNSD